MGLEIPPLNIKITLESDPPESRILVRKLALAYIHTHMYLSNSLSLSLSLSLYIYIYKLIYIHIYIYAIYIYSIYTYISPPQRILALRVGGPEGLARGAQVLGLII